jgi:hypothetical protein
MAAVPMYNTTKAYKEVGESSPHSEPGSWMQVVNFVPRKCYSVLIRQKAG